MSPYWVSRYTHVEHLKPIKMAILVLSVGFFGIVFSLALGAYILAESVRKKTEKAIALFYRDHQTDCVMMLNQISLVETKKEIELQKQRNAIASDL